MKDVDNDAAVRMGLDGAVESASGVGMSLLLSRFIAAGNWKLHRLCRFQFRFVVRAGTQTALEFQRHCELKQATALAINYLPSLSPHFRWKITKSLPGK